MVPVQQHMQGVVRTARLRGRRVMNMRTKGLLWVTCIRADASALPLQEFMLRAKNRRSQTRYRAKQKV